MEYIIFLALLVAAFFISVKSGVLTEMAMDKLSPRDTGGFPINHVMYTGDHPPSYLFGKIAGYFFGMFSFLLCAVLAGPYGAIWGLLAAATVFPAFAFTIFAFVRAREAIANWVENRCVSC